MFGNQIYVAALVGVNMVRAIGTAMVGVIMAGRTGAAFAAQLGAMEVNEEIDALKTLGISPMEFLAPPRMLALALMMPLLGLYADVMGVLGGLIVSVGMLDISVMQYVDHGDIFIIMGGSGCGKSALLRLLVGLKVPARGKVLYEDVSFWNADPKVQRSLMKRVGILYQSGVLWVKP